jgi:dimethylargininase
MIHGLTEASLGQPDYAEALRQHDTYIEAMKQCGVEVTIMEAEEQYPDSTFIEDTAVLTQKCAIVTNPGAPSRNGEKKKVAEVLTKFYKNIETISSPGTVDGGDVMMVDQHFYIGLSQRTNRDGAAQFIAALEKHGYTGSMVSLEKVLHLKTGVSYLENNNLLAAGEFLDKPEFKQYNIIPVEEDESYAANSVWVNGTVLVPAGYPKLSASIRQAGYPVIEVDVSEFRKLDGGLSCLSLRF